MAISYLNTSNKIPGIYHIGTDNEKKLAELEKKEKFNIKSPMNKDEKTPIVIDAEFEELDKKPKAGVAGVDFGTAYTTDKTAWTVISVQVPMVTVNTNNTIYPIATSCNYNNYNTWTGSTAITNQYFWWPQQVNPNPVEAIPATPKIEPSKNVGTFCSGCNEDFPYADPVENFTCYKCRNGL